MSKKRKNFDFLQITIIFAVKITTHRIRLFNTVYYKNNMAL